MKKAAPYRGIPEEAHWYMTGKQSRLRHGESNEWDFYQISNDRLCLQFTIGHAAYAGQVSLMLFDIVKGEKLLDLNKILGSALRLPAHAGKRGRGQYPDLR